MNEKRNVLLLGAGFSKNFNGYLAEEVYLEILNDPTLSTKLKTYLLKSKFRQESNFELYYEDIIISNEFLEKEKKIIETILLNIYKKMDEQFQRVISNPLGFSYLSVINFIINKFSYAQGGSGYIFTLNQDLLLERLFADYLKKVNFSVPGGWNGEKQGALLQHYGPIKSPYYKYDKDQKLQDFDSLEHITTEKINEWLSQNVEAFENDSCTIPCLMKLHGSYYWQGENEKRLWILGNNKFEKIELAPILKLYFEKFEKVMISSPKEIYVVGYSFKDEHINRALLKSCIIGSQLVVVDVLPFNDWLDEIKRQFRKMKMPDFSTDWLKSYHKKTFNILFEKNKEEENFKFTQNDRDKNINEMQRFSSPYFKTGN